MTRQRIIAALFCALLLGAVSALAGTIDTEFLQRPWPNQRVREIEVGRQQVRWREYASKSEGLFAGVGFTVPRERQTVWKLANDYHDVGTMTPGVTAVRVIQESPTRQVIQVDVKVLWKSLRLNFEIEQDPPQAVRFRLINEAFGEYRGVCSFEEAPQTMGKGGVQHANTSVDLATWFKPSRPVPMRLLLIVERIAMLRGAKEFLRACEEKSSAHSTHPSSSLH